MQKRLKKSDQIQPWGIVSTGADQSLKKFNGKNVKVAVFDTGISSHEDLRVAGGVSFVEGVTTYYDDNGHGTHVTGTIAANNNKLGVVGVAPEAEIYAVKILDKNGTGNYSNIIAGLEWAIDNQIDVINMSLGGAAYSQALYEAVQQATNAGIIIVAAAGNRGYGADTMTYPAKYSQVVSVGAVDDSYQVASFSSRGIELDIVAPGTSILSTTNDGAYATMSGTSMAAPHVTGAIAALKSKNKKLSSADVVNNLYNSATSLGSQSDYGHGVLNVAKATGVSSTDIAVPVPIPTPTPEPTATPLPIQGPTDIPVATPEPTENQEPSEPDNQGKPKSEARKKYEQLLEGNYRNGELKDKFTELFGEYSSAYIKANYQQIFDIKPNEIDMAFLAVIMTDEQSPTNYSKVPNTEPEIEILHIADSFADVSNSNYGEEERKDIKQAPIGYLTPIENVSSGTGLGIANEKDTASETTLKDGEVGAQAINTSFDVDMEVISVSNTSVKLNLYYNPKHYSGNNILQMYDYTKVNLPYSGAWVYLRGNTLPVGANGYFDVNNLTPGAVYQFNIKTYNVTLKQWCEKSLVVQTSGIKTQSLSNVLASKTAISFTTTFPVEKTYGNRINYYDYSLGKWIQAPGTTEHCASGSYTINGLKPGFRYKVEVGSYNPLTAGWSFSSKEITTPGNTPSIKILSKTATSITYSAVFPGDGASGNRILVQTDGIHSVDKSYTIITPEKASNTNYTVTGLVPEVEYAAYMGYFDESGAWKDIELKAKTDYQTPNYQIVESANLEFTLEQREVALMTATKYASIRSSADVAYNKLYDLVGGNKPNSGAKMKLKSDRYLPWYSIGECGDPIKWGSNAIPVQILRMNYYNTSLNTTILHEISHNFDSYRWCFEPEALARLKEYYVLTQPGVPMPMAVVEREFGTVAGAQYKTYLKSQANRILEEKCYDQTVAKGIYSGMGLAYNLVDIADKIGWEPFKKTFRFFNSLACDEVPKSEIDKLNLFLSMLSEFSNTNVFSMIPENDKKVYEAKFGGKKMRNILFDLPVDAEIPLSTDLPYTYYKFTAPETGAYTIIPSDSLTSGSIYENINFKQLAYFIGTTFFPILFASQLDEMQGQTADQSVFLNENQRYYASIVSGQNSGTKTFKIAKTRPPCIVLIPGIMGSRLSYGQNTVWEPGLLDIIRSDFKNKMFPYLQCREDGTQKYDLAAIDDFKGAQSAYLSMAIFLNQFNHRNGYNYNVQYFPYDWRLNNSINAQKLAALLKDETNVTIIAHSMGGWLLPNILQRVKIIEIK